MEQVEGTAVQDFDRPFETIEPARLASPLVFSSPHSGSTYPRRFLAASRLDPLTLRRSEDAFVDELFLPCVALGAPLLRALFPRAYLDVNREPYELDPQIFDGRLPEFANTRSLRVAVGLGTIPRVVGDAQPIYRKPIPVADGLRRIETLYRPYHAQLKALIERARGWFGVAVLLDCHSMPSNAADVSGLDIVLGDRYGASAAPACRGYSGIEPQAARVIASAATSHSRADLSPSISARRQTAPMRFKSRSPGRSTSTSAGLSAPNDGPRSRKISSRRRRRWRWNWAAIRKWVAWRPNEGGPKARRKTAGRCCTATRSSAAHKSQRTGNSRKKEAAMSPRRP